MKYIFALVCITFLLTGCSKTETVDVITPRIIGQTYSGYSFTSTIDNHKMYVGYKFTSDTKALRLLLDENTRIVTQVEYSYTGAYPNFKVGTFDGVFVTSEILQIEGISMGKW